MLEPSLDLYGETYTRVETLLRDLLVKSHARYVMIVDVKGFVLLHVEALWAPKPPSLDSLATLIASNYSATTAIAKLLGEVGFKEQAQQGEETGTYIEELGDKALLVMIFDQSAAVGRIKLYAKKAVEQIRQAIANSTDEAPELVIDGNWEASTDALLDGIFGADKGQ